MPYFAAAIARVDDRWVGRELDLDDVEDLDAITDLLREVGGEEAGRPSLLFVEEDDEWFGVVRVDGDAEPRVFISDVRMVETSDIAAMLYEQAADVEPSGGADEDTEESMRPEAEPAGDTELLADVGTPGATLLELCAEEGNLPADIITAVCEKAGCLDELESLREG